jgi:hypothetical protein
MNKQLQKQYDERDRIDKQLSNLKAQRVLVEQKIMEGENLEVRAVLLSEKLTLDELIALVRSRQKEQRPSDPNQIQEKKSEDENE